MTYTIDIRNKVLDWIYNQFDPSAISAIWCSLHSGDPGDNGANELAASFGYARQNVTAAFPASASAALANTSAITFGPASGTNWAQATYFGFWSAVTAGTFYGGFALTNPQTVQVPNTASFAIGDLTAAAT